MRYGGEEFVAVLPGLSSVGAECAAKALLERIAALDYHAASVLDEVSISVGVVTRPARAVGNEDLIAMADAALYRAKRNAKNCFCMTILAARNCRDEAVQRISAA